MINDIIFLKRRSGYRGTPIGSIQTFSAKNFITGVGYSKDRKDIMYAFRESSSLYPMFQMDLETFEAVFSENDISTMQTFGVLSYNPSGEWVSKKYPMFKKEIYLKYGMKELVL